MQQKEFELELQVIQPNHEMLEVWKYIQSLGKRIIVISDMYMPKAFIAEMLHKTGFRGYSTLYVSSDIGYTKANGLLYKHVQRDLQIPYKKILHIGDNHHSDVVQAKKYGLRTLFYQKIMERYLRSDSRASKLYSSMPNELGTSILLGMKALHWHKKVLGMIQENYWESLGYEYAGVMGYAYMYYIRNEAKRLNIKHLLFIARDGYILQQIFDLFNADIQTRYVYAQRFFWHVYTLQHDNNEQKAQAIIDFLADKYKKIQVLQQKQGQDGISALTTIRGNMKTFQKIAKKEFECYVRYIQHIYTEMNILDDATKTQRVGIVDSITGCLTAQNLIQNAYAHLAHTHKSSLPSVDLFGFYWVVIHIQGVQYPNVQSFAQESYFGNDNNGFINWNFIELLFTSPESPIKGVDTHHNPIYDQNPTADELYRKEVYPSIASHAILFAQDMQQIFGALDVSFHSQLMAAYANCFCLNPSDEDIAHMASIAHDPESTHSAYTPIFTPNITLKEFLKSNRRMSEKLRSPWLTKKQRRMLALLHILELRRQSVKNIAIGILPEITPLCRFSLNLFGRSSLTLYIGRF